MKRYLIGLIGAYIGMVPSLVNADYCDLSDLPSCGSFEFGAQAIYLRPTLCDFEYVIVDNRPFNAMTHEAILPQKKTKNIDPASDWGFRVTLGYVTEADCHDIRAEYTYLHTFDKSRAGPFLPGGQGIWPTYAHPRYMGTTEVNGVTLLPTPWYTTTIDNTSIAQARSSLKLNYDALDLQFGFRSLKTCNLWLRPYAGLHLINLNQCQKAFYEGSPDLNATSNIQNDFTEVCWNKNTWGIGPLFGLDARYVIVCGFGLGGHLGAAVLAGETKDKMREHDIRRQGTTDQVNEALDVCLNRRQILFPYLRASLGINYLLCYGNRLNVLIEFGYEFSSYINAIGHFQFDDERGTGKANYYSFNLDGLYLTLKTIL